MMPPNTPPAPWSQAYFPYRQALLEAAIHDADLLHRLAAGQDLPAGHGRGLDERCIEYPWVLANLAPGDGLLLDAGSALNHPWLLDHPALASRAMHIVTLAPEAYSAWQRGISYLYADLRDLPLRNACYQQIVCVSTLEHVGFDNAHYGDASRPNGDPLAFLEALAELKRVLRPGGSLFLTLPFGQWEDLGIAQQFDEALLRTLVEAFAPARLQEEFFRIHADGWRRVCKEDCRDAAYLRWAIDYFVDPASVDPHAMPATHDSAAAARAVACLHLVK